MKIRELCLKYGTDKDRYGDFYDFYLGRLKVERFHLLEIGVQTGNSLRMWEEAFPLATITGVDIAPLQTYDNFRVETVTKDIKDYIPILRPTVIVDDGSHIADDIVTAFHSLWKFLMPGGWYIIEDLAVQESDNEAMQLINDMVYDIAHLMHSFVSELHVHPNIVFMKKVADAKD